MQRTATLQGSTARAAAGWPRQYLSFCLCGLEYGVEIEKVREWRPLTELEPFVSEGGMISAADAARGVIMPIVDLRIASGCGTSSPPGAGVIIVQRSSGVAGMVVDGVNDIVALTTSAITPVPGRPEPFDYLLGRGQADGRRLILIDLDKLMSIRRPGAGITQPKLRAVPAIPAIRPPAAPDPS